MSEIPGKNKDSERKVLEKKNLTGDVYQPKVPSMDEKMLRRKRLDEELEKIVYDKEPSATWQDLDSLCKKYPHIDREELKGKLFIKVDYPTRTEYQKYIEEGKAELLKKLKKILPKNNPPTE